MGRCSLKTPGCDTKRCYVYGRWYSRPRSLWTLFKVEGYCLRILDFQLKYEVFDAMYMLFLLFLFHTYRVCFLGNLEIAMIYHSIRYRPFDILYMLLLLVLNGPILVLSTCYYYKIMGVLSELMGR